MIMNIQTTLDNSNYWGLVKCHKEDAITLLSQGLTPKDIKDSVYKDEVLIKFIGEDWNTFSKAISLIKEYGNRTYKTMIRKFSEDGEFVYIWR